MVIQEEDFRLESVEGDVLWDLELLRTVKSKSGEVRQEFQIEAYGVTLEYAMRFIIKHRIENKTPVLPLKEYVEAYKQALKELKKLLGNL